MAAPDTRVNVLEKFAMFQDQWSPKIIGQINDMHIKAVKLEGDFVWHTHDDTDEFFMVHSGRLMIQLEGDRKVTLEAGEFFIVPRGVEHRPVAENECEILLLEPAGVINTGDGPETDRTAQAEWI